MLSFQKDVNPYMPPSVDSAINGAGDGSNNAVGNQQKPEPVPGQVMRQKEVPLAIESQQLQTPQVREATLPPAIDKSLAGNTHKPIAVAGTPQVEHSSTLSTSAPTPTGAVGNDEGAPLLTESEMMDGAGGQTSGSSSDTPKEQAPVVTEQQQTRRTFDISNSIPNEFKGSTNEELIEYLQNKIKEYEPKSKEDLQKMRRRQRAEGIIAGISDVIQAIANLGATSQYAPNMYDAKEGMSAKAAERFEKEKKEREEADERYFNYALNLARLKGEDRDRALNIWMQENNMQRQDRAYYDSRADRDEDVAWRDKTYADQRADRDEDVAWRDKTYADQRADREADVAYRDKTFDYQQKRDNVADDHWQQQFDEGKRQFNIGIARSGGGGGHRGGGGGGHRGGGGAGGGRRGGGGGHRGGGNGGGGSKGLPHMLGTDGSYGYVSLDNWENDKYIDQLYSHVCVFAGKSNYGSSKKLFRRSGGMTANEKRRVLNHYFNSPYGDRDAIASEIMIFDASYGSKK